MIRTIIIDDEPSAVEVIRIMLQKKCAHDVEVIASSHQPEEGIRLIRQLQPDLVFLDIEMPALSGIEVAQQVQDTGVRVIFITAYDAYAIHAFRVHALDYLLKPVDGDDLVQAIQKVKSDVQQHQTFPWQQLKTLEQMLRAPQTMKKIGIGMAEKIEFVDVDQITYCQANGAYTTVYMKDGSKLLASKSLGDFQEQLESAGFFRIHHSYLINLNQVKEYQRHDGGYVVMQNQAKLEVSQRKRKDFLDAVDDLLV